MGVGRKELIALTRMRAMPNADSQLDGIEERRREGCCWVEVGTGTDLTESRTQIFPLLETKLPALRRAMFALGEQAALSESTTFLNSANFNFDNLGPKRFLCLVLFLSR